MRTPHRHNWNTVHRTPYLRQLRYAVAVDDDASRSIYLVRRMPHRCTAAAGHYIRINAAFRGRGQCARRNTVDFESAQKIFNFAN